MTKMPFGTFSLNHTGFYCISQLGFTHICLTGALYFSSAHVYIFSIFPRGFLYYNAILFFKFFFIIIKLYIYMIHTQFICWKLKVCIEQSYNAFATLCCTEWLWSKFFGPSAPSLVEQCGVMVCTSGLWS